MHTLHRNNQVNPGQTPLFRVKTFEKVQAVLATS
jgi:hypothetical protein